MKTNTIKLILLTILLYIGSGCDDQLDLADPNNALTDETYTSDKGVKLALIGAYNALSDDDYFGGSTQRNSELMAANDEVVFSGTFNDVSDIFRKEITSPNNDVASLWIEAYNTINISNNILNAMSVVNEADQEQVQGEALFLRGISYFELVKYFALPYSAGNTITNLAVPLMLEADINSLEQKPRNTVEEVYTQIVSDLTEAEALLAEGPNPGKATKEAAAAFLSRVYLQMAGDDSNVTTSNAFYALARDAADRAISTGNYELTSTVAEAFAEGSSSEDLFDIPVSTVDGTNNLNVFYASATNGGRGDVEVMPSHLALYEVDDERADLFYIDDATDETRVGKWIYQFGNVKVIRLAELYLTRAECNERLGTTVGDTPLNDVDLIRGRAGLGSIGTATLAAILQERRLELAHEGQRLHDIKRLMGNVTQGIDTFPFDDPKLVFPVPQREMDVNSNLIQNEGY